MTTSPTSNRAPRLDIASPGRTVRENIELATDGLPGFLRVDTVHQGDRDGAKGVYLINLGEGYVGAVGDAEATPVLDGLLGLPSRPRRSTPSPPPALRDFTKSGRWSANGHPAALPSMQTRDHRPARDRAMAATSRRPGPTTGRNASGGVSFVLGLGTKTIADAWPSSSRIGMGPRGVENASPLPSSPGMLGEKSTTLTVG